MALVTSCVTLLRASLSHRPLHLTAVMSAVAKLTTEERGTMLKEVESAGWKVQVYIDTLIPLPLMFMRLV